MESGTDCSRTEEYGMRTLLDYVGLNPLRPLVAFGGDESGGDGGDSRPEEAKALDETETTPSSVIGPSGYVSLDAIADSVVESSPGVTYSHMGQTYDNVFDYHDAIFGRDKDPAPAVTSTVKSTPVPVVSAVEPEQTTLESLAQEQYLSYDPTTVDDFMVDMDPFDVETIEQLAEQYYDGGSDPLSVSDQVAQYDPAVNLDLRDIGSELASGKISVADVFSPLLSDDDMGLPDISVDEAMFTRGDIGQSDVDGGTSISLDPLDDDPYSATVLPYYEPGSDEVVDSTRVPDVDIPSNKNVIDAVVAGVLTGTPVEGFDIQTSKLGMPREGLLGDLNNLFGSLGGQIILDNLIPGAGLVTGFSSIVDPQKRQRIADMLSGYSGQAVYNSKGELIGAVDKMTGEYVGYPSNEGGFVRGDDGNLVRSGADVPKFADPFAGMDDDDVSGCPAGYEFDANIGQCVPIISASSDEEPKISLKDVDRSDPPEVGIPIIPAEDPVEGMKIRTPKFFNRGGPVTPNIDRFLGSLRG